MKKNMDFIIVPRSIFESDAFGREPFSKREAFLDLVQMAAYESGKMFMAGHTYPIERGQLVVSKSYLVKRWRWNVDKVRRFLQYLERNGMCNCKCYQERDQEHYYPITLISIASYDSYQGATTSDAATDNTSCTTTSTTQYKEIINNNVEEKNNKIDANNGLAEAVERIYKLYPSSVVRTEGNRVSLKSPKDKEIIKRLLKSNSEEHLSETIRRYLSENPGAYTKMFSTLLHKLPDYGDDIFSGSTKRDEDWLEEGKLYYESAFAGHEDVLKSLNFELIRHIKRNHGALKWKEGKFIIA